MTTSRRALLSGFLAMPLVPLTKALARGQEAPLLPLTRACEDEDEPTLGREAGPFFKPNAPLKRDLFHDAPDGPPFTIAGYVVDDRCHPAPGRSEEHTSELQSRENLVCRLLLEK